MVERPTEKPGAILTQVPVLGAARDFSPRSHILYLVQTLTLTVSVQPPCVIKNRMHQHLCARFKIPHTGSRTSSEHTEGSKERCVGTKHNMRISVLCGRKATCLYLNLHANFWGNSLYQATKRQLTVKL